MPVIDGIDLLNGKTPPGTDLPCVCINKDFEVVVYEDERFGFRSIGQGRDLEGAKAIARLFSGIGDHYVDFTDGAVVSLFASCMSEDD